MFDAVAKAIKWGTGSNFSRLARCNTSGVSARQTISLTRKADNKPDSVMVTAKSPRGVRMRDRAHFVSTINKPDKRM